MRECSLEIQRRGCALERGDTILRVSSIQFCGGYFFSLSYFDHVNVFTLPFLFNSFFNRCLKGVEGT